VYVGPLSEPAAQAADPRHATVPQRHLVIGESADQAGWGGASVCSARRPVPAAGSRRSSSTFQPWEKPRMANVTSSICTGRISSVSTPSSPALR